MYKLYKHIHNRNIQELREHLVEPPPTQTTTTETPKMNRDAAMEAQKASPETKGANWLCLGCGCSFLASLSIYLRGSLLPKKALDPRFRRRRHLKSGQWAGSRSLVRALKRKSATGLLSYYPLPGRSSARTPNGWPTAEATDLRPALALQSESRCKASAYIAMRILSETQIPSGQHFEAYET